MKHRSVLAAGPPVARSAAALLLLAAVALAAVAQEPVTPASGAGDAGAAETTGAIAPSVASEPAEPSGSSMSSESDEAPESDESPESDDSPESDESPEPTAAVPPAPSRATPLPALDAPLAARARLLDIAQVGTRLLAVGEQGVIAVSEDGNTWKQVPSPSDVMLTRLHFLDAQHGWAVGYDATILHTADGGLTWKVQHSDIAAWQLYDVLFLDPQNGIAVGGFGLYLTTADGGATWQEQSLPLTDLGQHFSRLLRLDDGTLFVAGERGMLARSADRGATWQMLRSPYAGTYFNAMALDGKRVLAFGMRGNAYIADDITLCPTQDAAQFDPYAAETVTDPVQIAALGWRKLESPTRESLLGATLLPGGEVMLVGINGTVARTELAAGRMSAVRTQAEQTLADVISYGDQVIAVGKLGVQPLRER